MEKQLPKNWVESYLGDILELKNGFAFKSKNYLEEGIPVLRISEIKNEKISLDKAVYVKESSDYEKYIVERGDILIAMSGATTGKYGIYENNQKAYQNQRVGNLRLYYDELINKKFVYYLIGALKKEIEDKAYGGAQPNISSKLIENTKFKLPPLAEQERIVAKLDSLFAELDIIKERLANIPTLLKNFRQSVLNQAVTGKLTEEWREGKELESFKLTKPEKRYRDLDLNLPEYWKIFSFESIANIKSNLKNPKDYLNHILVAPNHIEKNTGILAQIEYTRDIMPKSDKHFFKKGAIIYSKIRPYLNKVILADFDGLCSADMYPITSEINREYLFYYMLSSIFLSYATTAGERSVLPKINQKSLNIIPVPVPPLKEQQKIVKRIEALLKQADNIQAHYEALVKRIEVLPQAILTKAFRGELVPQLPTDGDAKELLAEIKKLKNAVSSSAVENKKKRTVKK
ncbi:restriction endonuclease subunit S [uncultured Tenacibaculum sp.]|uniref:restriction endonuclease subunit S n=1 Tax=uncultured Tenacibaculum sp. TaxID=174713 RepID=UPI0026277804|nr:restriction endonuclease subunit S [uncultured Tenacibaculum sp.]